jgi:hypothetical protein
MDWQSSNIYWNKSRLRPLKNILIRNAWIYRQSIASSPGHHETVDWHSLDHDLQSEIHYRETLGNMIHFQRSISRSTRKHLRSRFGSWKQRDFLPFDIPTQDFTKSREGTYTDLPFPKISVDYCRGRSLYDHEWSYAPLGWTDCPQKYGMRIKPLWVRQTWLIFHYHVIN